MFETSKPKPYDLEERTFQFAKHVGFYVGKLPKNISNLEYGKQGVGSSEEKFKLEGEKLLKEAIELKKILSAILKKSE
jgi:hypothetical protein